METFLIILGILILIECIFGDWIAMKLTSLLIRLQEFNKRLEKINNDLIKEQNQLKAKQAKAKRDKNKPVYINEYHYDRAKTCMRKK
jgi:hypothetical protein